MQDLIDAAILQGIAEYEENQRKLKLQAKLLTEKEVKLELAVQWVTEELPSYVTKQIAIDPTLTKIRLTRVHYKNKVLESEMLAKACAYVDLKVVKDAGFRSVYEEGLLEEYEDYYLVIK